MPGLILIEDKGIHLIPMTERHDGVPIRFSASNGSPLPGPTGSPYEVHTCAPKETVGASHTKIKGCTNLDRTLTVGLTEKSQNDERSHFCWFELKLSIEKNGGIILVVHDPKKTSAITPVQRTLSVRIINWFWKNHHCRHHQVERFDNSASKWHQSVGLDSAMVVLSWQ